MSAAARTKIGDDLVIEIAGELAVLRRGRGLFAPDVRRRVGPRLYAVAGGGGVEPAADTDVALRDALLSALSDVARAMPGDLRFAALTALAARPDLGEEMLTNRLDRVARFIDRDRRTARRRVDDALVMLAENLAARLKTEQPANPDAPPGWFVDSLDSTLTFDPTPHLLEHREIVATVDGLRQIVVNLSMSSATDHSVDRLRLIPEEGCVLARPEHASGHYWRYVLALPKPLRAGQSHRYAVSFVATSREAMMPFYTMAPMRRCRSFSAEVRFTGASDVEELWRVDGVPYSAILGGRPTTARLRLDEGNSVRVAFSGLQQGLAYGVQWRWAQPGAG